MTDLLPPESAADFAALPHWTTLSRRDGADQGARNGKGWGLRMEVQSFTAGVFTIFWDTDRYCNYFDLWICDVLWTALRHLETWLWWNDGSKMVFLLMFLLDWRFLVETDWGGKPKQENPPIQKHPTASGPAGGEWTFEQKPMEEQCPRPEEILVDDVWCCILMHSHCLPQLCVVYCFKDAQPAWNYIIYIPYIYIHLGCARLTMRSEFNVGRCWQFEDIPFPFFWLTWWMCMVHMVHMVHSWPGLCLLFCIHWVDTVDT